jgi:hypothetical protein
MKAKGLWTALVLSLVLLGGVLAYDATTPYTVTMKWIIPTDTSFLVVLAGAETTIDFNPATKDSTNVEPDSQSAIGSVPIINLYNSGNVNVTFKNNATLPSWAKLMVNNASSTTDYKEFNNTEFGTIQENVPPSTNVSIYLWTNVTSAAAGTTTRSYSINASAVA